MNANCRTGLSHFSEVADFVEDNSQAGRSGGTGKSAGLRAISRKVRQAALTKSQRLTSELSHLFAHSCGQLKERHNVAPGALAALIAAIRADEAAKVRAATIEECAKVMDAMIDKAASDRGDRADMALMDAVIAIRALGEKNDG